jgi:dephospho-CoA kinase
MSYLSNNNVVLVQANENIQRKRLEARGYTTAQMKNRLNSQFTHALKKELLTQQIEKDYHGQLWEVDNSIEGDTTQLRNKILDILQEIGIYPKS